MPWHGRLPKNFLDESSTLAVVNFRQYRLPPPWVNTNQKTLLYLWMNQEIY